MDSETEEKNSTPPPGDNENRWPETAAASVDMARERFLEAASAYEPLGFVRKHPFLSVGGAFAAGIGISRFIKSSAYLPLLPLGAQIVALTAKLGLLATEHTNKRP